ncbi:hypothetical protein A2548_03710 [candidate division WOR-1 bacterium RIFOXYD2_FULL_41_8]|nr:MAG: hypothetical protein A2548_03710 [candidate division WOR-1 bacterium RIFOXYD2_FULL_41_8]
MKDTIKQVQTSKIKDQNKSQFPNSNFQIQRTLDRDTLWLAQTPQVFRKELLVRAYKAGYNKGVVTDDAMLVEKLDVPVVMVMGSYQNIKITTPEDLRIAEGLIKGVKE